MAGASHQSQQCTMGHITIIAVLTLLYLHAGDSATPIPNDKEYVYSYTGFVKAKNSGTDVYASQWSVAAKLVMQSKGNDIVMKFKDIKTNLFNGEFEHAEKAQEKALPEEAHHLYLPFVVHYQNNGSVSSISHQPDDLLWSLNMKRAIASIVQIDVEHTENLHEQKFFEQSIYGSCEAAYTITHNGTVKTIAKTIDDSLCVADLENSWSSCLPAPGMTKDFKPISTVAVRTFHFLEKDSGYLLEEIQSHSNITYQTMHNEISSLQLIQSQVFHLESNSVISEPIDVSKSTESTTLEYVFVENDSTSGRQKKQTAGITEMMEKIKNSYGHLMIEINKFPLVPGNVSLYKSLAQIFNVVSEMDKETLDIMLVGLAFTSDPQVLDILISMLPYIGTNTTVHMIKKLIEDGPKPSWFVFKALATFPKYVNGYTTNLLEQMELLIDRRNLSESDKKELRYAGMVCFAAMVAEAHARQHIPVKQLEKYSKQYMKYFEEAQYYEEKMTYLLALINVGSLLDSDTMISIITDKEQSHHLRSLAAYGFKPYLTSNPEKMFERLWHEVLNQTEHYEVRVAVLDLLMSSQLSQVEFDTILEEFKHTTLDPSKNHLQNYLSSSISSLHNETMYFDYLGAMVAESIDTVTIPSYNDAWTTGNYRLSYTDSAPNFGGYIQARLVANPLTNSPNVIQLTYNKFAMSLNLGTYTAYIKMDGIDDMMFIKQYLQDRPNHEIGIAELLELIRKFNFQMMEDADVHVEVVLFCDNRVVFFMHHTKDSLENYMKNPLFLSLIHQLPRYEFLSYPKMHVGKMRSDLGTSVSTSLTEAVVVSHKLETNLKKLFVDTEDIKSGTWHYKTLGYEFLNLESYNPLADVNIDVYKYKNWGQRFNLSMSLNVTGQYLKVDNEKDSINLFTSRTIGTTVDRETVLKEYCSSCETNVELPLRSPYEGIASSKEFGVSFNITMQAGRNRCRFGDPGLIDSYRINSKAAPLAEPLLMVLYGFDYFHYLCYETGSLSIRSNVTHEVATENILEWDVGLDEVYNENDPINGTDLHASVKLSCRKKDNAEELGTVAAQYKYTDGPVNHEKTTGSHVVQVHKLRGEYSFQGDRATVCFDREFKYPSRRSDMWSILPVEPAKGNARLSMGFTKKTDICSDEFVIEFYDIFEPSMHQMDKVKEMDEYEQCKKESEGFKYTAATLACGAVHDAVSKYQNYTFFVDLSKAAFLSEIDKELRTSDHGLKLFEIHYVRDDIVHVQFSKEFLTSIPQSVFDNNRLKNMVKFQTSLGVFSGMEDPTTVAYGAKDAKVGLSFVCDINPNTIFTFTNKIIEHYESKDDKEIVAYVECFDESRGGMTIQKYSDKKIGFTMWSGDDKLVTSYVGDKLKVALNGNELHSQYSDEHFKVYFLEDDVLYINNQIVAVYYNTEYISIKAPAMYNKYVCGLCADGNKHVTSLANEL